MVSAQLSSNNNSTIVFYSLIQSIIFIAIGTAGFYVGNKKSKASAKFYIFLLFLCIVIDTAMFFDFIPNVMTNPCYNATDDQVDHCNDLFINSQIFAAVIFAIFLLIVCAPMLYCPLKLYRNASVCENRVFIAQTGFGQPALYNGSFPIRI